jgi:hypothetical protein
MKRLELVLATAIALTLAGCVLRGKQTAKAVSVPPAPVPAVKPPSPPPQPLSISQPHPILSEAQPISPEALATIQKLEPPVEAPSAQGARTARRPQGPKEAPPKPETPPVQAQTPPAPEPAPPEQPRPAVQELVSPAESKRLQDFAHNRRQEVAKALDQLQSHALTNEQRTQTNRIRSFLQLSDEAEKRGDMRQADALAERAQDLMRELQSAIH